MKRLVCGILFIAACTKAESKQEPKPAPETPTATAPATVLASAKTSAAAGGASSADALATGFQGKPELSWHGVTLGAYQKGDEVIVRAGGVDVTRPLAAGDTAELVENELDEVVLIVRTAVAADEGGASLAYQLSRIWWDQGKPIEAGTWSCDETVAKAGCALPAWADAKGSAPLGDPLEQGLDRSWRDGSDACKTDLSAAEKAYQDKYTQLCVDALTRVTGCARDPLFETEMPVSGVSRIEPAQISPKHVGESC
jgi:hypothetical protein